jgi:hypothetical protein
MGRRPAAVLKRLRPLFFYGNQLVVYRQKKGELSLPFLRGWLPMPPFPKYQKGSSASQAHALPWWFSRSHPLLRSVHPYGSNGGAFAQDQPDLQSIAPWLLLRTRTAQGQWESR